MRGVGFINRCAIAWIVAYMKVRFGIFAVIIAGAVTVAAWVHFRDTSARSIETAAKPVAISLVLNGPFDSQHAGEIIAARAGLFERDGLRVELKPGGNGRDPIASVANGTDTFGVTEGDTFLVARSKGEPIVAFGAGYLESPVVFYTLEKSGIHTPRDFIGKRVGRRAGTDTATVYDALLINTGISRSSIRETATDTDVTALLNDKVDVIPGHVGKESFVLHQKGIPYNVIRVSDYGIHMPGTVYFTSEKFIHDYPSVAQRVLRAIIAGWNMTFADTSKSISLIVSASDNVLTPEQVQFELAAQRDFVRPPGRRVTEFDDLQWKQLRLILMSSRLIDGSVDMSRAINLDILKEAYRKSISFGN